MRNHYFKPENQTDNIDFTIFGLKMGPVPDLQELLCTVFYILVVMYFFQVHHYTVCYAYIVLYFLQVHSHIP